MGIFGGGGGGGGEGLPKFQIFFWVCLILLIFLGRCKQ